MAEQLAMDISAAPPRRLHVGGRTRTTGWEVMDAIAAPHVDHVGDARDLRRFADGTFEEIYASHVLEHFDYATELPAALQEWRRVLVDGGRLYVSVPDLDILAQLLLLKDQATVQERYEVMRMMFGGQRHEFDYHYVGLNEEFLAEFLRQAGFVRFRRVPALGIFEDMSGFRFGGVPISLNAIAEKA